jgi:hypothetical protein
VIHPLLEFAGGSLSDVLAHPMVLLLAGGVLTGMLVPLITRRWQNRQKALELKTGLVTDLSDSVTRLLLAVQLVRSRRDLAKARGTREPAEVLEARQATFDEAYVAWETASATLRAKLLAYFPTSGIERDWNRLAEAVTVFYALEGQDADQQRVGMERIVEFLELSPPEQSRDAIRAGILRAQAGLVQRTLKASVAGL